MAARRDFFLRLTRGLAEASGFILDGDNKSEMLRVAQKKNLRLRKSEKAQASYKALRLMTTLDLAPNPAAFKIVRRILGRLNPKINQVDLEQIVDGGFVRTLETSGGLGELRIKD